MHEQKEKYDKMTQKREDNARDKVFLFKSISASYLE